MRTKNTDPLFERFAEAFPQKTPPDGHEMRFLSKLNSNEKRKTRWTSFRLAAMILVLIGMTSMYLGSADPLPQEVNEFYQTEAYFQTVISEQWKTLPVQEKAYAVPVTAAKEQLQRLQNSYQKQSAQFHQGTDHPKLLRAMITNLQKQLEILNDLSLQIEHINNNNNETERI